MEVVLSALAGSGDTDSEVDAWEAGSSVEACMEAETASGTLSAPLLGCGAGLNELWTGLTRGWSGFGTGCFAAAAWSGTLLVIGAETGTLGGCPKAPGPWRGPKGSSICPANCLGTEAGSSCSKGTTLPNCTPGGCCSPDG